MEFSATTNNKECIDRFLLCCTTGQGISPEGQKPVAPGQPGKKLEALIICLGVIHILCLAQGGWGVGGGAYYENGDKSVTGEWGCLEKWSN